MEGLVVGNETIEFQLLNKLGSGGYGTVYRARCLDLQDKLFAIKVVELGVPGTQNYKVRRRELDYHFLLQSHPNIVGFHGHISDDDHTYMIMDYCPGGNLRHAITKKRIFARNDALVKSIFLQLIDAIQACHDAGIYHRDLKPENILINPQMTEVYVTDFGLSTKKLISTAFGAGTTHYMSPGKPNCYRSY